MKTVCFDFDGVIHSYETGWQSPTIIPDPPVDGIKEVLQELKNFYEYKIVIHSSRCSTQAGITAIWKWLIHWDLADYIDDVVATKPSALVYVDDRGLQFTGKTNNLVEKIVNFHSYR